jgi:outer membrane protein assembly factor BamA
MRPASAVAAKRAPATATSGAGVTAQFGRAEQHEKLAVDRSGVKHGTWPFACVGKGRKALKNKAESGRRTEAEKRVRCWRVRVRLLCLCGLILAAGCGVRTTAADLYPGLSEFQGRRVSEVRLVNTAPFATDSLHQLIDTQPTRCRFLGVPLCVPFTRIGREEHRVNVTRIAADVRTLQQAFRIAGYFNTQVTPDVQPTGEETAEVTFTIERGPPIVLDVLTVTGTEEVMPAEDVVRLLPLQPGSIFHLGLFTESADRILRALQRRGYAYAEVLRSFTADTIDNRAEASLDVVTGPVVVVDSIVVRGAPNLGREAVLRQLEIAPGELLRQVDLLESQRNLYQLELVSLASVTVAPPELQATPGDQSRATLMVSVVEAPLREVDAAVGFGTIECLRTDAQWLHRSFGGGARHLSLRASASRLGVGEPFAIGAGRSVCPTEQADTLFGGQTFDYRLSADFTQPYFMGPRNQLGLSAFAERQSEPGIYQREGVGGGAGVSRRLGARSGGSVGIEVERGSTRAAPALFCAAFLVCEPVTIDSLAGPRFRSELAANYFVDRANAPLDPSRGTVYRAAVSWAPSMLGSNVTFFRGSGTAIHYRPVGARGVAAFSLRLGNFFRTIGLDDPNNFLPPEDRFYAGGSGTVRGFARNALGPGVYVTDDTTRVANGSDTVFAATPRFVPTGGTALAIANAELRLPSPFWSEFIRLVAFVDAGALGTRAIWDVGMDDWRITPGAGLRVQTPVGPVRFDVGYNPYDPVSGPLLFSDLSTGRVVRVADQYQANAPNLWGRLRIHLAIGHAY